MKKNLLFLLITACMVLVSCSKDDPDLTGSSWIEDIEFDDYVLAKDLNTLNYEEIMIHFHSIKTLTFVSPEYVDYTYDCDTKYNIFMYKVAPNEWHYKNRYKYYIEGDYLNVLDPEFKLPTIYKIEGKHLKHVDSDTCYTKKK